MGFFGKLMAAEQAPPGKQQLLDTLREEGDRYADWVESLTEDVLAERVKFMPGMTPPDRTRFEMLLGVKEHEI